MIFIPALSSNEVTVSETKSIIKGYIGGVAQNYIKPTFPPEYFLQVNYQGTDIKNFDQQDINKDSQMEAIVGDKSGAVRVSYMFNGKPYAESVTITQYNSGGSANNYIEVDNFPILSIIKPESYKVGGDFRERVMVGSLETEATVQFKYDSVERGQLLRDAKSLSTQNTDLEQQILDIKDKLGKDDPSDGLAWKNYVKYSEGYDAQFEIPSEITKTIDEVNSVGTGTIIEISYGGGGMGGGGWTIAYRKYMAGNSLNFYNDVNSELFSNRAEVNTITNQMLYQDKKATVTVMEQGVSGSNTFSNPIVQVVDGIYNYDYVSKNPSTYFIVDLGTPNYVSKILIKGSHIRNSVEILNQIYLSNNLTGEDYKLLTNTVELGSEFHAETCRQMFKDSLGVPYKDDRDQYIYYLPYVRYLRLNISGVLNNATLCGIEIYVENLPDREKVTFYTTTLSRYADNVVWSGRNFGPDTGNVLLTTDINNYYRANWWYVRPVTTSSARPYQYGPIAPDNREFVLRNYLDNNFMQLAASVLKTESTDKNYCSGQKLLWSKEWDNAYQKKLSYYKSLNQLSVNIAKNNNKIENYKKSFVL